MKNFKILTVFIVLVLALALVFCSCDKAGEETTAAPESTLAPSVTDTPTEPADETTAAPETIAEETTSASETTVAPETTKVEETTEAPHTHSFGAWNTVKAASCTEEGTQERNCSCGEKETQTVAKVAHRESAWITDKDATCTEAGSKHVECEVCKNTVKTESVPALGHTDGAWIIDKEATATADGSKHLECSVCKASIKTEVIPASPHTPGEWIVDKDPTCTETGLRHRACTKCGETVDTETISAKGHNAVTDAAKAATCTEDGKTEGKHCSVCKAVIKAQDKIPAKGHTEVIDKAIAVTCTEDGKTEGKHCSVCKVVIKAQEKISAKGHTESDWIIDKAATTAAEGSKHTECTVCKATLDTAVIPKVEIPKVEYSVTVKNGDGSFASGVEVIFTKGSSEIAKVKTDGNGTASVELEEGEYGFTVDADASYFVSANAISLTKSAPATEVMLVPYVSNPRMVYPGAEKVDASGDQHGILAGVYDLTIGSYRISVEKNMMRYIFFAPEEGAIYHFYTDSDKIELGYYGASFYVTSTNNGTILEDGTLEVRLLKTAVGNTLVIGLKSTSAAVSECTLTIEKYQEIGLTVEELPWEPYGEGKTFEKIKTPEGYIVSVEISVWTPTDPAFNELQVFYNEADGYYHFESIDGPILYVRITSKSTYQEALSTVIATSNLGKYIYDENGNFVTKESYNDILIAYGEAADSIYGVYPLDQDLYYILKSLGDIGWYDGTSPNYIFAEEGVIVKPFNGWLFACVYFK